jgi:hypothetical protein
MATDGSLTSGSTGNFTLAPSFNSNNKYITANTFITINDLTNDVAYYEVLNSSFSLGIYTSDTL